MVPPQSMPCERETLTNPCPRRENPTDPWGKRDNLTETESRAHSLAMTYGSMHMERDFRLAMTHEGMHALEVRISDIDWGLSLHPIAKSNELSSCHTAS